MKRETENEYLQSVYRVVAYIEAHGMYELTLEELSRVAGFSKYHFHRIFKSVIGENVGDYVRRVRLSNATVKFRTDKKITQIALESGFETSASFSKAFKNHFGLSPREFGEQVRAKKGVVMQEPKYVDLKPVEILCVRRTGPYEKAAAEAAEVLMKFAYTRKIKHKKNLMGKEARMYGIGYDDPKVIEAEKLRCDICISYDDKSVQPEGEVRQSVIEGGRYAMFLHKGAYSNLKETYAQIADWIVQSGTGLRDLPMFERYLNRDPRRTKPENLRTEIYVPVC